VVDFGTTAKGARRYRCSSGDPTRLTVRERIIGELQFTPGLMAREFQTVQYGTVSAELRRMMHDGEIERTAHSVRGGTCYRYYLAGTLPKQPWVRTLFLAAIEEL